MSLTLVFLTLIVACAPAANDPTGPVLAVNLPSGPMNVTGARSLSGIAAILETAVNRFYTSSPERLEQPILLENVTTASLEAAFRRGGVFVQSRWSYLGTAARGEQTCGCSGARG
jgi:hypothetical protein